MMKAHLVLTAGAMALAAIFSVVGIRHAKAAPGQDGNSIIVQRADGVTSGVAWDVTLPPGKIGHIQDQAWLVVDGKSQGLGGGDIPSGIYLKLTHKPLRLYANINDDLDGQVKDILKAQGMPIKADVTTYRTHYGAVSPREGYNGPVTLHFRNSSAALLYKNIELPETATYKMGERITLFDAVALDSAVMQDKPFDMNDPKHSLKPGIPLDMAHHIQIQVQFFPTDSRGRLITSAATK